MNLERIRKSVGERIQLRPPAMPLGETGSPTSMPDDIWIIEAVLEDELRISLPRTGHITHLGKDHIHHYTSNPDETRRTGVPHGFLTLNVQVFLRGARLTITPTLRPGEAVAPPSSMSGYLPQPASALHAPIPRIAELPYDEARDMLIEAGWQPYRNHWSQGSRFDMQYGNGSHFWNKGYHEITNASGTGLGHCEFRFKDVYGNLLVVITAGEVNVEQGWEALVWNWYFNTEQHA